MSAPRTHAWRRERALALRLGLLEPAQEAEMRAHLETCVECRELLETSRGEHAEEDPADRHIPAEILARWPRAQSELRGLERVMVRRHLERCAACRQDLEAMDQEPVLKVVPALEPGPAIERVAGAGVAAPVATTPNVIRIVTDRARRAHRNWTQWAFGSWALAASAAALLLLVRPPAITTVEPILGSDHRTSSPTPEPPLARLRLAVVPNLGPVYREGGKEPGPDPVVTVTPGTTSIALPMLDPLPEVADSTRVTISLLDESGAVVTEIESTRQVLAAHKAIVLSPGPALREGRYRLRYTFGATGASGAGAHEEYATHLFLIDITKP